MKIQEAAIEQSENLSARRPQNLRRAAFQSGIAKGRDLGYQQGFQDGFLAAMKNRNGEEVAPAAEGAPVEVAPNGKRLVGPPCAKCGHCYPGALTQCPRCKNPTPAPIPMENMLEPEFLPQSGLAE